MHLPNPDVLNAGLIAFVSIRGWQALATGNPSGKQGQPASCCVNTASMPSPKPSVPSFYANGFGSTG